ncbi:MAG: hypothetical protein QOE03_1870, partial [Micromonosporaceae bacterium]|nr:hypothetical protein [Micromonosporaceae bacterium]
MGRPTGDRPGYRAGTVTRLAPPPPRFAPVAPSAGKLDPARRNRLMLRWFGGTAIGVLVLGLVIVLGLVMTGGGPLRGRASGPSDTRPDLAKLCPPPPQDAGSGAPVPPPPAGPRTVDSDSGISYQAFSGPWLP